jgi:hypothetical protein
MKPKAMILLLFGLVTMSIVLAKLEIVGLALSIFLMVGPVYFIFYSNINCRFYSAIGLNFFDTWCGRYIKTDLPIGFAIDGIMI